MEPQAECLVEFWFQPVEQDAQRSNPEGVEVPLAQDGAEPGSPIRAVFARIGVGEAESWVGWVI